MMRGALSLFLPPPPPRISWKQIASHRTVASHNDMMCAMSQKEVLVLLVLVLSKGLALLDILHDRVCCFFHRCRSRPERFVVVSLLAEAEVVALAPACVTLHTRRSFKINVPLFQHTHFQLSSF